MRTLTALVLTAALALPALAQPQRPGGGRGMFGGGGNLMLLVNEDVQKDLKLTDEQKEKLRDFQAKQMESARENFQGGNFDRERMQEMMQKALEASNKFMKDTLTDDQTNRLKQISLQQALKNNPASAFFAVNFSREGITLGEETETGKALKLTDDQKEKIKDISDQMRRDMAELRPMGGGAGGRPMPPSADQQRKIDALRKETTEKMMEVLTEEQHKTLKELQGPPFEGRLDRGFGGFGGGRRPGGGGGR